MMGWGVAVKQHPTQMEREQKLTKAVLTMGNVLLCESKTVRVNPEIELFAN